MISTANKIRVAIVGGGTCGLCLAIALLKHDQLDVQIYEAAAEFAEIGAGLALGPNAQRALHLISPECSNAFETLSTRNGWPSHKNSWFRYVYGQGRFADRPVAVAESEVGQRTVHRAKLLDALAALLPDGAASFGKRLASIAENDGDGSVVLRFQDGSAVTADCVIGADGLNSATRRFVLGDDAAEGGKYAPRFAGGCAYRALVPMEKARLAIGDEYAQNAHIWAGYDAVITVYPIDHGQTLNVACIDMSLKSWEGPATRTGDFKTVEACYSEWSPTCRKIVDMLDHSNPLTTSLWELPELPYWFNGNVALVGDAAHAMTPHQGAGAGQAIEDAFVLGAVMGMVKSKDQIAPALQAFDKVRRPRASRVAKTSLQAGEMLSLRVPEIMDDPKKLRENIEWRLDWIWNRDIDSQRRQANYIFDDLVSGRREAIERLRGNVL